MIRVLVVDDDRLFRAGLRMILESDSHTEVVAEAVDGVDALTYVQGHPGAVDIVLLDLSMPRLGGVEAARRLAALEDSPRVLVLTTYADDDQVYAAITAGASGFLLKDTSPDALIAAIAATANGTAVVSPQLTARLVAKHATTGGDTGPARAAKARLGSLTDREIEVLRLIGRGLNNSEICAELFIAEVTVKTHVGRVIRKLGARDRVQCVVLAYEAGLVSTDPAA